MLAITMVISVAAMLGFILLGGPLVVDWARHRREEAVERQIELTDALDEQLGPVVAPMVRKLLWGPWEIRMEVSMLESAPVATILRVVDELFSTVPGGRSKPYRIVLVAQESPSEMGRPTGRWAGKRLAAA